MPMKKMLLFMPIGVKLGNRGRCGSPRIPISVASRKKSAASKANNCSKMPSLHQARDCQPAASGWSEPIKKLFGDKNPIELPWPAV
jgi:hypothetical protein